MCEESGKDSARVPQEAKQSTHTCDVVVARPQSYTRDLYILKYILAKSDLRRYCGWEHSCVFHEYGRIWPCDWVVAGTAISWDCKANMNMFDATRALLCGCVLCEVLVQSYAQCDPNKPGEKMYFRGSKWSHIRVRSYQWKGIGSVVDDDKIQRWYSSLAVIIKTNIKYFSPPDFPDNQWLTDNSLVAVVKEVSRPSNNTLKPVGIIRTNGLLCLADCSAGSGDKKGTESTNFNWMEHRRSLENWGASSWVDIMLWLL